MALTPHWLSLLTLVPCDHYSALGIEREATDNDIELGYQASLTYVQSSTSRYFFALLLGRSPARLARARIQLLDPSQRKQHDEHLAYLSLLYDNPPP